MGAVDLVGSFVFAVEGAMAAILGRLDFFGVMVIAFATAFSGGIFRDILIGAVPPNALKHRKYALTALVGGSAAFLFHRYIWSIPFDLIMVLDAAGLSLFAVSGAAKALDYSIDPMVAVILGAISGIGGGVVRDILLRQVPAVLRVDIYAVAALAGATVMVIGIKRGASRPVMMTIGFIICFSLRVVSVWQHWNLPTVSQP